MDLPHTLALARELSPSIWAERAAEVERLLGHNLNAEQRRAWTTIVGVFSWFATPITHSPNRPAPLALWAELHEMLVMAADMGAFLGTPAEDLIVNVELWARPHIPVSHFRNAPIPRPANSYADTAQLALPPLSRSPSPV